MRVADQLAPAVIAWRWASWNPMGPFRRIQVGFQSELKPPLRLKLKLWLSIILIEVRLIGTHGINTDLNSRT